MDSQVNRITATVLNCNELRSISDKLRAGELVIVPSETNWLIIGDPNNDTVTSNLNKLLHLPNNTKKTYLCLGKYDSKALCELNDTENRIFDLLVDNIWPKPLAIYVKKLNIIVKTTGLKILRNIIYEFGGPLLVETANIFCQPKNNSLQQIMEMFENKNINILNKDYISEFGIDDTIVQIDNDSVSLYKQGYVSSNSIGILLASNHYDYNNDEIYKIPNKYKLKNIYNMCILDINELTDDIPKEIIDKTQKMLENTILVDFNKINLRYKSKFMGYADISESGDSKEVLFNYYNILHQIIDGKYNKIFVTNFKFKQDQYIDIFWKLLSNISEIDTKIIGIPKQIIDKL